MKKLKNRSGLSMAEMLLVVAIIIVLLGIVLVALNGRRRSLGQLERDSVAKEIFIAAQNHLTAVYGEGYLGLTDFGVPGTAEEDAGREIYYFTVNGEMPVDSVMGKMLPFGAIDETVRRGGSYVVRYQKSAGLVLDVFYCTRTGSPEEYNHTLAASEYETLLALRDTDTVNHKKERRDWNGSILGWYGGEAAALLPTTELAAPTVAVINAEKLYVKITDPNRADPEASLKLIVTGLDSGAQLAIELQFVPDDLDRVIPLEDRYTVILDDVTTPGLQFGKLRADVGTFLPGEDLSIQAVAYSATALTKPAYSPKTTVNSLFGSISREGDTAYVGNLRHLANLDPAISNLAGTDGSGTGRLQIAHAEQTDSFGWIEFQKGIVRIESEASLGAASETGSVAVAVVDFETGTGDGPGCFLPIEPDYELTYDGRSHSISDLHVDAHGAGGLFGVTQTVSEIRNLELIDFQITASGAAGALAGELRGCAVTNVLVRNTAAASENRITAPVAGGLAGRTDSETQVRYSAASVLVSGETAAGGLIGAAAGEILGCYSGGHTKGGSYGAWLENHPYAVTGGIAGGLVGVSEAVVRNSYSTCSVSGTVVGGLAGSAEGSISNSYATGLIDQGASEEYAFLGRGGATVSGSYYYMYVNEIPFSEAGATEGETTPMDPVRGYFLGSGLSALQPIDLNDDTYNDFTGAWEDWSPAIAFDSALVKYYGGRYTLATVRELDPTLPEGYGDWNALFVSAHYGDWPSPEVFFINE